jgi:hypothetical protein
MSGRGSRRSDPERSLAPRRSYVPSRLYRCMNPDGDGASGGSQAPSVHPKLVCRTAGIKLRGSERSEDHVSFNGLVGQHPSGPQSLTASY